MVNLEHFKDTLKPSEERLTSMTYWFPILKQIRMRVPETIFVYADCNLSLLLDGENPKECDRFFNELMAAGEKVGYPVFLRTEQLSDKHSWSDTCFVKDASEMRAHVRSLVESSHMANIAGQPFFHDFWAVRKMLDTEPVFTAFPGKMPITTEHRFFIRDGKVECHHPYWPEEAFSDEKPPLDPKKLKEVNRVPEAEMRELKLMAEYIAKHFTGYWSIDFLRTKGGVWYCIDMAVGDRSYHYPHEDSKK